MNAKANATYTEGLIEDLSEQTQAVPELNSTVSEKLADISTFITSATASEADATYQPSPTQVLRDGAKSAARMTDAIDRLVCEVIVSHLSEQDKDTAIDMLGDLRAPYAEHRRRAEKAYEEIATDWGKIDQPVIERIERDGDDDTLRLAFVESTTERGAVIEIQRYDAPGDPENYSEPVSTTVWNELMAVPGRLRELPASRLDAVLRVGGTAELAD